MAILDRALEVAGGIQKDRLNGQLSFFDTFEDQKEFRKSFQDIPNIPEWQEHQLLAYEKQLLGFYITKHPLARYEKLLANFSTYSVTNLANCKDGEEILLGGIINKAKITVTKKSGEKMAIVKLEDLNGMAEVLVFPNTFQKIGGLIKPDAIVFFKGRISLREDEPRLITSDVIPIEDVKEKFTKSVNIDLFSAGLENKDLDSVKGILSKYPGQIPVYLNIATPEEKRIRILAGSGLKVQPADTLIGELEKLLGEGVVNLSSR